MRFGDKDDARPPYITRRVTVRGVGITPAFRMLRVQSHGAKWSNTFLCELQISGAKLFAGLALTEKLKRSTGLNNHCAV